MKTIKIWNDNPSEKQLIEISEDLRNGKIAIIPTDTVYGIVCDSSNVKAIERICKIKHLNPEKNTLSIICSGISMAAEYSRFDNKAFKILKENTPGPFTFIFKSASTLPKTFKGRKSVGVRIPDNRTATGIAESLGSPLMNASIDFSDEDEAMNPDLIAEKYENLVDLMVIGEEGSTELSTIVDFTGNEPEITRQGKGLLL